jgi:hypothetical protein
MIAKYESKVRSKMRNSTKVSRGAKTEKGQKIYTKLNVRNVKKKQKWVTEMWTKKEQL